MTSVSVALATRDGARHLPVQLASLLDQERRPDELVVVDDGSSDASVALVEAFAEGAPFPVVLEHRDAPAGVHDAFGRALAMAGGDVVALCDQDDRWDPDHLGVLVAALPDPTRAVVAFGDARLVDERGEPLRGTAWDLLGFGPRSRRRFARDPMARLLRSGASPGCTMAATRAAVDAALPLPPVLGDPASPVLHDRWLCLVAAALGEVVVVDEVLGDYRRHRAQASGSRTVGGARAAVLRRGLGQVRGAGEPVVRLRTRARQVDALRERAEERGASLAVCERLRAAAEHLQDRSALPPARRARLVPIARGLREHRYRWAGGVAAAAADAVRPLGLAPEGAR